MIFKKNQTCNHCNRKGKAVGVIYGGVGLCHECAESAATVLKALEENVVLRRENSALSTALKSYRESCTEDRAELKKLRAELDQAKSQEKVRYAAHLVNTDGTKELSKMDILRLVHRYSQRGMSSTEIANTLNEQNILSHTGKRWTSRRAGFVVLMCKRMYPQAIQKFLKECCVLESTSEYTASSLAASYNAWAEYTKNVPIPASYFGYLIGCHFDKRVGGRFSSSIYVGVTVKPAWIRR